MSKWKTMKRDIRSCYRKARPVYELDYSHILVRISDHVVYDLNDDQYYAPQTGVVN